MSSTAAAPPARKPGFIDRMKALGERHVRIMLLLGFSSGLPFLLSVGTLGDAVEALDDPDAAPTCG